MAALVFKVGGDSTGLGRSLDRAKGMLGGLARAGKRLAIGGAVTGAAVALGGLAVAYKGLRDSLDLGGRLSDVASNTGLMAGEALVLERALQDAGISGDKLQGIIQKMQKAMVEGGEGNLIYSRAFAAIGLSISELRNLAPAEQFAAVQAGLASLQDPAERSARAMQIFGRSGGELGALFSNSDALGNARDSVGGAAEILNKSADSFDRSADLLGGVGAKLQGFFVGMASFINPVLLPVLEEMNKMDLSKQGAELGKAVAMMGAAFKDDSFGGLVSASMVKAAKDFINFLSAGFLSLGLGMGVIFDGIGAKLKGYTTLIVGALLKAAATLGGFLPEVLGGLSDDQEANMRSTAARNDREGLEMINGAFEGLGAKIGAEIEDKLLEGETLSTAPERETIGKTLEALSKAVEIAKADAETPKMVLPSFRMNPEEEGPEAGASSRALKPIVSSLAKIGGAKVSSVVPGGLDLKRNQLLMSIEKNTRNSGGGMVAVYG
jgi:hypothetical protein